jgi:predicted secreted protein
MDRGLSRGGRSGLPGGLGVLVAAVAVVVGLLVLVGCGSDTTAEPLQKGSADNGQVVTLSQGQELQVSLEGNPTTGFTWEAQGLPAILEQKGDPEYARGGTAVGAGGVYTFTFTGTQAGDGQLTMIYHRTFESGVPPEQTYTLKVTVK